MYGLEPEEATDESDEEFGENTTLLDFSNSFSDKLLESSETDESEEGETPVMQKRRTAKYVQWKQFIDLNEFDEFWANEKKDWRVSWRSDTEQGEMEYWLCRFSKRNSGGNSDCKTRLKIIFSSNDNSIKLEISNDAHNHAKLRENKLSSPVKIRVRDLVKLQMEPARILNILRVIFTVNKMLNLITNFSKNKLNQSRR